MDVILEQVNSMGNAFVDFALPMLVQSSVLIVVLFGLDLILRKRVKAVFRYWIWVIVLLKLVLPTTLSSPTSPAYWLGDDLHGVVAQERITPKNLDMASPIAETRADKPMRPEVMLAARPVESMRFDPGLAQPVEAVVATPAAVPTSPIAWKGFVFLLWLAVVTTMTLLLIQRTFFVKGLIAQSKDASAEMLEIFEQGREQMKVRRSVALRLSAVAVSPSVCGLFRPTILIPQSLADKLNSQHLRSVILHELAHIRRGDLWVSLFQTVLQIIYVYNPLLWVANAMIRKIREAAVDEMVLVAMGEKAEDYLRTLLDVSRLTFSRPALSLRLIGVVESKKALTGRIKHMASKPFPKTAKLGVVGLLGVITIAAVLLPMARARKVDTVDPTDKASSASMYEGKFELHKPLAVDISAGTDEHPERVRIEWIRFDKIAANAWGVTARVAWSPATDASWRLKVELLDQEGQVLQHSRDQATIFITQAEGVGQATTRYADLDLDFMQYEGRRHARRFRVHLEPWHEQIQDTDLADPKTHTLEVVVIDQKSRAPLADAAVVVSSSYSRDTYRRDETLCSTDSPGRCKIEFSGDRLSSVRVGAQKQGFATNRKSWANSGSWPIGSTVLARLPRRHVLELIKAGAVGGLVRDKQGNPLSEVEVRFAASVEDSSGRTYVSQSVQTDANGRWQVDGVPSETDRVSVGLRHAVYGGDNGRNRRITGEALLDIRALKHVETLDKGLTVTGKVLDDQGKPVASATVMMASRSFNPLHTLTDESGAFQWVCMADISAYREPPALTVEAPGYAPVRQTIDLKQKLDGLEFRLTRGRSVVCRVVDTEGKPVVGASTVVHPLPENSNYLLWLKDTNARGEFQIPNVPESDVDVSVLKSGYISVRDFVVGPSEDEVVITMRRALRVYGTVRDAENGRPMPNFEIAAIHTWQNKTRTSTPAAFAEGVYELNFGEARSEPLQLQASAVGYEPATSQEFRIDQGQRAIDFKLMRSSTYDETTAGRPREEIKPTGPRRITGTVRDAKGDPVSDAIVSTRPWIAEETTTDAEGAFTLRTMRTSSMRAGTMGSREETTYILVRHKERNLATAVELDDNAETVDIQLIPGMILSGKVADVEGKGIPDAEITLTFWNSGSGYGTREVTEINGDGYYRIRAVPPGHRYSVTATAEGYGEQYVLFNTTEAVDDGMELEPLVLAAADRSLSGVVIDVEGKPVAGVRVNAYGRGQPRRNTTTDEQGKFVIENMCTGRIQVQANTDVPQRLHGRLETEGGATDVKIVVAERDAAGRRVRRQPPSLLGKPLPDLKGISVVFSPEQHKDKMILVCFWDMNQRPSRNCSSQLAGQAEQLGQKGVAIVAIQASKVDENALDKWVRANDIPFPVGTIRNDDEKTRWAWSVRSLPWLILTDKDHIVRAEGFSLSDLEGKLESND